MVAVVEDRAGAAVHGPAMSATVKPIKRSRKKILRDTPPRRSSVYRGVTRHRWTGRYEAHLWDKNCWNPAQNKKGRQVYLGAYDDEEAAAHAYDLAALKYWGQDTLLNFPLNTYTKETEEMKSLSKEEYVGSLRRKSSGFSRGVSKYRGVARHHHNGRWEARIGRVFGNKYLYLGTYSTQEEAAAAYDMAAIEYRGLNAVTNFDLSRYIKWLRPHGQNGGTNIASDDEELLRLLPLITKQNAEASAAAGLGRDQQNYNQNNEDQDPDQDRHITAPAITDNYNAGGHDASCKDIINSQVIPARNSSSTALGLLLQSSKFKEMLEKTAASGGHVDAEADGPSTSSNISESMKADQQSNFAEDIEAFFQGSDMFLAGQTYEDQHVQSLLAGSTYNIMNNNMFQGAVQTYCSSNNNNSNPLQQLQAICCSNAQLMDLEQHCTIDPMISSANSNVIGSLFPYGCTNYVSNISS